jgi:hypothetical protein
MGRLTYDSEVQCDMTPFRFERDMVKFIASYLPQVFEAQQGQKTLLIREQAVGTVIPDLMFGIWSGDLPRCSGFNAVSRQIFTWLSVQKRVDSEKQLREELFVSEKAVGAAVSVLKRAGAIAKYDSGELEVRPDFNIFGAIHIVAIEMKLKRWREALAQAIEYRAFANEAYVALDRTQVRVNDVHDGRLVSFPHNDCSEV